jgi:hypothetical protein
VSLLERQLVRLLGNVRHAAETSVEILHYQWGGPIDDREKWTAYLLGELSAEEESTLELEYLCDDEVFERLVVVEDELAYDYVDGRLSVARRFLFERIIAATERGRRNVEFARYLLSALYLAKQLSR